MAVGDLESDLHHKKNAPSHPPGHEPGDFPPYVYKPFPAWMYHETEPARLVKDDSEQANLASRGFVDNPNKTREAYERLELEKSNNAAQRASDDRGLSAKAKAEHEAADSAADDHVLDLPVPPAEKRKPGRPAKTAA